jgi:hypothetical protein
MNILGLDAEMGFVKDYTDISKTLNTVIKKMFE